MYYFIFNKNSGNSIYKIAANEEDLNLINGIQQDCYLKITTNENDFNFVKLGQKSVIWNGNSLEFSNMYYIFTRQKLYDYIKHLIKNIECFLDNNLQHSKFQIWSNYLNYLKNININSVLPTEQSILNTSLEEYIESKGQTSYSIFQLP